jgi:hypothetical protein
MSSPLDSNRRRPPQPGASPQSGSPGQPAQPGQPVQPGAEPPQPPQIPKKLTRQTTIAILIGVAVLFIIALTRLGGPTATITAKGIGPLEIGHATRTEMQQWATGPITFWFKNKQSPPVKFKGQLWQYKCIGGGPVPGQTCRTLFGITHGHVATVETSDPRYHTAKSRVGTSLSSALANEHGKFSGWRVACPHITLPAPKGTTFLILVARSSTDPSGYVSGFYLSATPSSFSYC